MNWETYRQQDIRNLTSQGLIPAKHEVESAAARGEEMDPMEIYKNMPLLMGQVDGSFGFLVIRSNASFVQTRLLHQLKTSSLLPISLQA